MNFEAAVQDQVDRFADVTALVAGDADTGLLIESVHGVCELGVSSARCVARSIRASPSSEAFSIAFFSVSSAGEARTRVASVLQGTREHEPEP